MVANKSVWFGIELILAVINHLHLASQLWQIFNYLCINERRTLCETHKSVSHKMPIMASVSICVLWMFRDICCKVDARGEYR